MRSGAHFQHVPRRRWAQKMYGCGRSAVKSGARMPITLSGLTGTGMRYHETRDRSIEILRQALPLMSRQRAAFHPLSFTLWYEHIAGLNPELTRILEARLASNVALTDDDVQRLYT